MAYRSHSFQDGLIDGVQRASIDYVEPIVQPEVVQAQQNTVKTTSSPIGLLSNPLSFYNRRRPVAVMKRILGEYPEVHQFPVRNRDDIRQAVTRLKAIDAKLVIANGGDGTVQGVITEIWRAWEGQNLPRIGIMPGGRTNVISFDLNGRLRPREVLKRLLEGHYNSNKTNKTTRHLLTLSQDGAPPELGFLVSGAGLAAGIEECWSFRHRMRKMGLFGGLGTATWVGLRLITTPAGKPILPPRPARVVIDGEALPDSHQQILMVTVNKRFPVGIQPFWRADNKSVEPEGLKVTVVRPRAKGLWWRSLPLAKGWGRFLPRQSGYFSDYAQTVEIQTEQSIHLDGESRPVNHSAQVNIELGPSLEFLTV